MGLNVYIGFLIAWGGLYCQSKIQGQATCWCQNNFKNGMPLSKKSGYQTG